MNNPLTALLVGWMLVDEQAKHEAPTLTSHDIEDPRSEADLAPEAPYFDLEAYLKANPN